jgi:hypothetical protein
MLFWPHNKIRKKPNQLTSNGWVHTTAEAQAQPVSRLEATFICLVLHGWGVGGRWWHPYPSSAIPHVRIQHRATGWHRMADQVISSARSKQVIVEFSYPKDPKAIGVRLYPLSISTLELPLDELARKKYLRSLWKIRYPEYFRMKATMIIPYACGLFCIR